MMQFISDNYFYIVGILAISILTVKYLKSKKSKEIEKIWEIGWEIFKKKCILIATIYKYRHIS